MSRDPYKHTGDPNEVLYEEPSAPDGRWVICTNDYPYVILPEGTTEAHAYEACSRLNAEDEKHMLSNHMHRRINYHTHFIVEIKPEEVTPWPRR